MQTHIVVTVDAATTGATSITIENDEANGATAPIAQLTCLTRMMVTTDSLSLPQSHQYCYQCNPFQCCYPRLLLPPPQPFPLPSLLQSCCQLATVPGEQWNVFWKVSGVVQGGVLLSMFRVKCYSEDSLDNMNRIQCTPITNGRHWGLLPLSMGPKYSLSHSSIIICHVFCQRSCLDVSGSSGAHAVA